MVYDDGDGDGMRMRIIITNLNTNNCTNDSSNPLNGQKRYIFVFSLKCITGFKHKYPYIEFNGENPKKNVLMNMSVYVKRHRYFKNG